MVAVIGLLAPSISGGLSIFGVALTTAGGALTVAGTLLNGVAALAINSALNARSSSSAESVSPDDLQVNSKVTAGERFIHIGAVKVGGNHVFHRGTEGISYRVVVFGEAVSSIEQIFLGRDPVTLDASDNVTDKYVSDSRGSRVNVKTRLGGVPESDYSQLGAVYPEWTVNHRLDGLCSAFVRSISVSAEEQNSVFPLGEPEIQVLVHGKSFPDPRTNSTAYTQNAALVINGFAEAEYGLNEPGFFDEADVIAEANAADLLVSVVGGGQEERWRLNGTFSRSQRPQDVLAEMMASCAARFRLKGNGKFGLRLGRDVTPEVTLTDADIIRVNSHEPGAELFDRFNEATATYTEPNLNYTQTTCNPITDANLVTRYGGTVRAETVALPYAPSNRQAQDVLIADMHRRNPLHTTQILFRVSALEAINAFEVTMAAPLFGYVGKYEPTGYNLVIDGGFLVGVQLDMRRMGDDDYSVTSIADQGEEMVLADDSQEGSTIPSPTNLSASGSGIETAQGVFSAGVSVAWDAPSSETLTPVLKYEGVSVSPNEMTSVTVAANATTAAITGLVDGELYDIQLQFAGPDGGLGPVDTVSNVAALASSNPPAAPSGLAVEDLGGGSARVTVTAPTSSNYRTTKIFRDAVEVHSVVTSPGAEVSFVDVSGVGTFDWTASAVNVSGISSATLDGPISQTIT